MSAGVRGASRLAAIVFGIAALLAFGLFVALGVWQLERRAWKLDLMARVEQRVHAVPVTAPDPGGWSRLSAARDGYRHVRIVGSFLHDRETLVRASTVLGGGWWVLTPLVTADGTTVLVNRGFVASAHRERASRAAAEPAGEVAVTGLLRLSEPGGLLLQHNDAAAGRWVSRDVDAIARARGLFRVAPYFIDADAPPRRARRTVDDEAGPVAGLTVIAFRNDHLVYAITWFALALLVLLAAGYAVLDARRRRAGRGWFGEDDGDGELGRTSPSPPPGAGRSR